MWASLDRCACRGGPPGRTHPHLCMIPAGMCKPETQETAEAPHMAVRPASLTPAGRTTWGSWVTLLRGSGLDPGDPGILKGPGRCGRWPGTTWRAAGCPTEKPQSPVPRLKDDGLLFSRSLTMYTKDGFHLKSWRPGTE